MKHKSMTRIALCALLCAVLFTAAAFAIEDSTHTSDITLGFKENNGPTDPVNPDKPDENSGEEGTGALGPLSMDWVSPINFSNELLISGTTQLYSATSERPYIQVTDNRGAATGWKVTATLSPFQQEVEGAPVDTLPGTRLHLLGGESKSAGTGSAPEPPAQGVTLLPDAVPVRVVTASFGQGTGTWVHRWYPTPMTEAGNTNIQLDVPGGTATVGTHTATITWILSDAP